MKVENQDVLIIGGGLAGCAAAKAAADAGKKATMIFETGGASELSSGCLDLFGVIPGEEPEITMDYCEGIKKIAAAQPGHPYAYAAASLDDGLAAIVDLAKTGGYEFCGFDGKNVWVPNLMGTFTLASYVPSFMKKAVPVKGEPKSVLVVGFKGNIAFNAVAAAMSYKKYQKQLGFKDQYYSLVVELDGMAGRHKLSDSELADYFDTEEGVKDLADKLNAFFAYNIQKYDLVLLPPVLGFINYNNALKQLEEACGLGAAEVLVGYNAVVGFRMTRAIYKGLSKAGVTMFKGSRAKALSVGDAAAVDCTVGISDQLHPGESVTFEAPAVVLATGGFIGGGVQARRREVWLDLLEENLGEVPASQLNRDPVYGGGQDVLKWGADVDADLAVKGDQYKGRVFACGDFLKGFNAATERSGSGVAAATGYLAGVNAAGKA